MNLRLRMALCATAACFLVKTVAAQGCPAPFASNPLNLISGQSWAFQTHDALDATIGVFTAQALPSRLGGPNVGVLSVTESFNNAGNIQEQTSIVGSYQINPNCSGGSLSFASSFNGFQYQFVFADNFTKMLLANASTSTANNTGVGVIAGDRGIAVLLPATPSCTGVAQPLSLFAGTWSFKVEDLASATIGQFVAAVGTSARSGQVGGSVTGTETTVNSGFPFLVSGNQQVQLPVTGPYNIYGDCSGGHLFMGTPAATQYAFVFAGPNKIFLLGVGQTTGIQVSNVIVLNAGFDSVNSPDAPLITPSNLLPRVSFGGADHF